MTTSDSFDRRLAGWLESEAQGRVTDHLAEVLVTTRATRQRRSWSSLERWLPMTSIASARLVAPRPLLPILLVVGLLVVAIAAALLMQVGRPAIPPFGSAANGRIVYVDGATVRSAAPDGTDQQTIATLSGAPAEPVISPDGRLVAVTGASAAIDVLKVAGSASQAAIAVTAPGMSGVGGARWSPTGDRIMFVGNDSHGDHLFVANADGSQVREVSTGLVASGHVIIPAGFSPDGALLGFVEGADGGTGRLVVVAPDGTGARALKSSLVQLDGGAAVSWSPDPSTARLLYVAYGGPTYYVDLKTDTDVYVAIGFWPSWSPTGDRISFWNDGTKIIQTPLTSAGARSPIEVFPSFTDGCGDHPELAGKALCGPVTWSPDGTRVIGTEVLGNGLLSLRSDGAGDPRFLDLATNVDMGAGGVVAWQPVAAR